MPIYEYRCAGCEARFEELIRGADTAVICPSCAGAEVERLLSRFAGVGGSRDPKPDYSRLLSGVGRGGGGGCCGGGGCRH